MTWRQRLLRDQSPEAARAISALRAARRPGAWELHRDRAADALFAWRYRTTA